jgi:hypothetical protein
MSISLDRSHGYHIRLAQPEGSPPPFDMVQPEFPVSHMPPGEQLLWAGFDVSKSTARVVTDVRNRLDRLDRRQPFEIHVAPEAFKIHGDRVLDAFESTLGPIWALLRSKCSGSKLHPWLASQVHLSPDQAVTHFVEIGNTVFRVVIRSDHYYPDQAGWHERGFFIKGDPLPSESGRDKGRMELSHRMVVVQSLPQDDRSLSSFSPNSASDYEGFKEEVSALVADGQNFSLMVHRDDVDAPEGLPYLQRFLDAMKRFMAEDGRLRDVSTPQLSTYAESLLQDQVISGDRSGCVAEMEVQIHSPSGWKPYTLAMVRRGAIARLSEDVRTEGMSVIASVPVWEFRFKSLAEKVLRSEG